MEREFKAVFVDRISFDHWVVRKEDGSNATVLYKEVYSPILFGVEYTLQQTPEIKIVDGRRLWNSEVHARFFPMATFKRQWDAAHFIAAQTTKSAECSRWLQFDLNFHLQSLIPTIPVTQYAKLVRKGAEGLAHLVYKVGGVQPLALKRAGGSPELVRDAWILKLVTDIMKQSNRSAWLSDAECAPFTVTDPDTQEAFGRLIDAGVLVQRNVGTQEDPVFEIALAWAARLDARVPKAAGTLEAGTLPPCHRGKKPMALAEGGPRGDPRLRQDAAVDKKTLPLSMASAIAWPRDDMPPLPHAVSVKDIKTALDYIRKTVKDGSTLLFSTHGIHGIEATGSWTCVHKREVVEVQMCLHNPAMVIVDGKEVEKKEAFAKYEHAGRQKWTDIHRFANSRPTNVAGIFATNSELNWGAWVEKFGSEVNKVLVYINPSNA